MSGEDGAYDDARIAECGAAEQRVETVEQCLVAAPVPGQGRALLGEFGGLQVGLHVGATEGVDRLLGIADQHQRRRVVEREPQHLPLHRVGVLELVDQHGAVAAAQACGGSGSGDRIGQRVAQPREQVLEADDAPGALATVDLGTHRVGEPHPNCRRALIGCVEFGHEDGLTVGNSGAGEPPCLVEAHRRRCRVVLTPLAQVEIVDHLRHQVIEVLDQHGAGVEVAGCAEADEHQLAELMDRHDRGRVERRERGDQALSAGDDFDVLSRGEVAQQRVVASARRGDVDKPVARADQALAHAIAQLLGRGPSERHHQQFVEPPAAFGDVARDERSDGEGLPGACARLEHRRAGR